MSKYDPEEALRAWSVRKATRNWIDEYPSIRRLALSIVGRRRRGSPATVNAYCVGIRQFVEFAGYTDPESLLADIKDGALDPVTLIDKPEVGFIDTLLERYANKTAHVRLYGVKKWLEVNDVQMKWEKVETPTTTVTFEKDRAPTREELRRMLDHCMQIKDRMALLVLSSSGLRIGTFLSLTWGDVSFDYEDVTRITVRRAVGRKFGKARGRGAGGESQLYVTWTSPEARQALEEYMRQRKASGEDITNHSPLMASDRGGCMTLSGFQRRYYLILERAGLDFKHRRHYMLHVHTLRKYFRSRCLGVDESLREHWLGHRGGYLDESYFRPEEKRHLEEYRKALLYLCVYPTPGELEKKIEERDDKVKQLEERLEDAQRVLGDRERRLLHLEQTTDLIMRALSHPEAGPALWEALRKIEEKAAKQTA